MEEINNKISELCITGIEPSLLLLGLKQRKELNDSMLFYVSESFRSGVSKINTYTIMNLTCSIIDYPAEDFCEVYGNSKY